MVHLQNLFDSLDPMGTPVHALVINGAAAQSSIMSLGEVCSFPVLQDTEDAKVFALYGAGKDTGLVIAPDGRVHARWQLLDVEAQGAELLAAIQAAAQ